MFDFFDWLFTAIKVQVQKAWNVVSIVWKARLIALLERLLVRLKDKDELRFDKAWIVMSPTERDRLMKARGQGLLDLRQMMIEKYVDEDGNIRNEFFSNRGFNHDSKTDKPP